MPTSSDSRSTEDVAPPIGFHDTRSAEGAARKSADRQPRITSRRAVLAAALLALVVAIPSLGHDFVYDDVWVVADREAVQQGDVPALLTESYWSPDHGVALWRPGALLVFAGQWAAGGGSPAVFHGFNITLYVMVAALFALLAVRLFNPVVGLAAGLLFAAHPVHVEVTANVVGQAELLSAGFYLGALLVAWRAAEAPPGQQRSGPAIFLVGLLTLCGIAVKEHVVTIPAAMLVLWWLAASRREESIREVAGRQWPFLAAMILPIGLYLVVRGQILGIGMDSGGLAPGLDPASPLQRVSIMLPVSLHWLRLLFWPVHLSADYGPAHLLPRPEVGTLHAAAAGIWLFIAISAWHARRKIPALAVGLAFFFITISVVSNVVVPLEILLAERLLFLPSAGWAIAMGGLAAAVAEAGARYRLPVVIAVAVVTVGFTARALDRVPVWADNEVFFAQMALDAPDSFRVPWYAAERAIAAGDTDRAEQLMVEALQRNPYEVRLAEDLGMLHLGSGRYESAIPLFIHALDQDLERRGALQGLAIALTLAGRGAEALRWLNWLEELHGPGMEVEVLRVEALRVEGRFRESMETAEAALAGRPEDWNLRLMAAESARLGGLCDAALRHVREGIDRAPEDRRQDFDRIRTAIEEGDQACH